MRDLGRKEMSEDQQQNSSEDLGSRTYPPPEEFAKNANIQDPEIWEKAAEDCREGL